MKSELSIRRWSDSDNLSELTHLLHRAYKPLAEMGLRFMATHQNDSITLERISTGFCYVVEHDSQIIATATLYPPESTSSANWYRQPNVAKFGQFAVEPAFQKQGIASLLLDTLEMEAIKRGYSELALDTAEPASHLIRYYERRGYRFIEYCQWDDVNYRSVIMSKRLASANVSPDMEISNGIEL